MSDNNNDTKQPLNKDFREPKIRFPEFVSGWSLEKLGDVVNKINRRNSSMTCNLVLTISARYGLVDQTQFFNKKISINGLDKYYLLESGDFAYNRSYSKDYAYGAIKRLDNYSSGLVSTLYIVFKPKENLVDSDFLAYYFETNKWNSEIANISGEGARNHGLLNLSPTDFFATKHWFPNEIKEQEKISEFIKKIFRFASDLDNELETLKKYKEGLIQNGLNCLSKNSEKILFTKLFNSISIPNTQMLPQYTVGVQGLKPLDDVRYDISKHKIFSENTLILGIGLEEIGISEQLVGSISPVYDVYEINDPSLTKYFKYFLKPMLWKQRNYLSRKSTRREFEVDTNELRKTLIAIPNDSHFDYFIKSLEAMDNMIQNIEKQTERLLSIKDFLLRNMFI